MKLKVKSFGCCDLKIGVLTIGILFLVREIATLVLPYAGNDVACDRFFSKDCKELTSGESCGLTIWSLINIISTILMIYGSQKYKPMFILPSILFTFMGLIVLITLVWGSAIVKFKNGKDDDGIGILIIGHAGIALTGYFFMVIYSRYKELRDEPVIYDHEVVTLFPL